MFETLSELKALDKTEGKESGFLCGNEFLTNCQYDEMLDWAKNNLSKIKVNRIIKNWIPCVNVWKWQLVHSRYTPSGYTCVKQDEHIVIS